MGVGREMDGCGQCIKYSMFAANFVIFVGGLVVLGIGVWTLLDKAFITELLGTNLFMGAVYVLISTGGLVAVIAFLGCVGAVKEVKCMLLMYFLIVFIVFVTMLVGGILGYVFREDVRKNMDKEMRSTLQLYNQKEVVRRAWDDTQENLHCCGVDGPSDWQRAIPRSCCRMGPDGKLPCQTVQTAANIYRMGCLATLRAFVEDNSTVLAGAAISVSFLMPLPCETLETIGNAHAQGCLNITEKFARDHASILAGAGVSVAGLMMLGMIFSCVLFNMI